MTWFQMYLFTRLDIINYVLNWGCAMLSVLLLFSPIFLWIAICDSENIRAVEKRYKKVIIKTEIIGWLIFSMFVGLKILIPSQKEMAAIIVVPAIANNEQIQKLGKNGLDLSVMATDYLKSIMEEKTVKLKEECEK